MNDTTAQRLAALRDAGRAMRDAQKYFFRHKGEENLEKAKKAERAFDRLLRETADPNAPIQGELL